MTSQWEVDMIQRVRLSCGKGAAGGDYAQCLKELEKIIMELDEARTNLKALARRIIEDV